MTASQSTITHAVQAICRAQFGSNIQLTLTERILPDDWGRNLVWRYRLVNSTGNIPSTVVAKISKIGSGHIFNEWASLEFLNQFDKLHALVPKFYGGHHELELIVLEDLGSIRQAHDLGHILEGTDPELARQALLAHARSMALLHSVTAQHEGLFTSIRAKFPTYEQQSKDHFEQNFQWFIKVLPKFGVHPSDALKDEIRHLIDSINDVHTPKAYTRGDLCPSNVAYHDGKVRFYDFEMGAYRSVYLSAVYFMMSHISCVNGNLIPDTLRQETEHTYFRHMESLNIASDNHPLNYAGAAIAMLIWILSIFLEKPDRPRHLATIRQRTFGALTLFTQNATFTRPYPHLTDSIMQLSDRLAHQWSDAERTIEVFPAFQK